MELCDHTDMWHGQDCPCCQRALWNEFERRRKEEEAELKREVEKEFEDWDFRNENPYSQEEIGLFFNNLGD